jgi:ferredoxin, 2Fe-2S
MLANAKSTGLNATFVTAAGDRREVEISPGESLMEAAVRNLVPGIVAECGGACACGTCLVEIAPEWRSRLEPASELEEAMLEGLDTSSGDGVRLSCQLQLTPELEGIEVTVREL